MRDRLSYDGHRLGHDIIGRARAPVKETDSQPWQFSPKPRSDRMLDHAVMKSVAEQLMSGSEVLVEGRRFPVTRTGSRRFRPVRLVAGGGQDQAIGQNPNKPSRLRLLVPQGHR